MKKQKPEDHIKAIAEQAFAKHALTVVLDSPEVTIHRCATAGGERGLHWFEMVFRESTLLIRGDIKTTVFQVSDRAIEWARHPMELHYVAGKAVGAGKVTADVIWAYHAIETWRRLVKKRDQMTAQLDLSSSFNQP